MKNGLFKGNWVKRATEITGNHENHKKIMEKSR